MLDLILIRNGILSYLKFGVGLCLEVYLFVGMLADFVI